MWLAAEVSEVPMKYLSGLGTLGLTSGVRQGLGLELEPRDDSDEGSPSGYMLESDVCLSSCKDAIAQVSAPRFKET